MISKTILCGWLAFPIEVKSTKDGKSYARSAVNIPRNYRDANGRTITDTINFVTYGPNAEYLGKYCKKGDFLILSGRLQTSSYTIQEAYVDGGFTKSRDKKITSVELYVEEASVRSNRTEQNESSENTIKEEQPSVVQTEEEDIYAVYERMKPTPDEDPNLYMG